MADEKSTIDVYYDMDIAQICQHFNKTRNTVDKAVAKLVKHYPDKGWKYKNPETKRITIKAEGVAKLSTYFRKEKHEISTVETELRAEVEKLTEILKDKDKTIANLEILYNDRLRLEMEKSRQTFLLEQKTKDDKISEQEKQLNLQNDQIAKSESRIQELESENQKLKSQNSEVDTKAEVLKTELEKARKLEEEYKRKEEEYNSKSFFYRLTHKFSLS